MFEFFITLRVLVFKMGSSNMRYKYKHFFNFVQQFRLLPGLTELYLVTLKLPGILPGCSLA